MEGDGGDCGVEGDGGGGRWRETEGIVEWREMVEGDGGGRRRG